MSLWDWLQDQFRHQAGKHAFGAVDDQRVLDPAYPPTEVRPGRDYFRVVLAEMHLKNDRDWFISFHPAVNALVKQRWGLEEAEIPTVAGQMQLPGVSSDNLDRSVSLNYPLTPTLPFNGGDVDISAALLGMQGASAVAGLIDVLSQVASLAVVPQLATGLAVARPLADGIERLLGATNGQLHLFLHQNFATGAAGAGGVLRSGYFYAIRTENGRIDEDQLWVQKDRLYRGMEQGKLEPFEGFSSLLLRVDRIEDRGGWRGLPSIEGPLQEAIRALGRRDAEAAESFRRLAVAAAYTSPDLTEFDQSRVAEGINLKIEEARSRGLGAVPGREVTLEDAVALAPSPDAVAARGRRGLAELLG